MTQKAINFFVDDISSRPPRKNYLTNKTDVNNIDNISCLDILDLKGYASGKTGYRYVLVVIDNFSKFVWRVSRKKINAQTIKDFFENINIISKKPNLFETDWGKKFHHSVFQNFLKNNNVKHYSRNTSLEPVFAECFKKSMRNLPKKDVFEWRDANWIDILPTITKPYNNRVHTFNKLTPIQASLKKDWRFCLS